MAFNVVYNGTTIQQWHPFYYNGVQIKNVIYNGSQTYKYLSLIYSTTVPDQSSCCQCAGAGWTGLTAYTQRSGDTYRLILYASNLRADYGWYGSPVSSTTAYYGAPTGLAAEIAYLNGRDEMRLRAETSFNSSDGKFYIKIYGRCKTYQSFTLIKTQAFEG